MKKTLTVTTDVGTFSRTTARSYSHVVVVPREADDPRIPKYGAWGVIGWSSRLDLAHKVRSTWSGHFPEIRIYDVTTGHRVI
jgi:hypothetical protein